MAGALNFNNVNMTGPIQGQPIDFATQQAQLQQAQQIAMALIAKGMTPVDPMFQSSPGNPFSRAVPNLGGMMAQVASGINGGNQLADVNQRQQELGGQILANRMAGIKSMFAPVAGPGVAADVPSPMLTPEMQDRIGAAGGSLLDAHTVALPNLRDPTMRESMMKGYGSTDPVIQQIAGSIMQHLGTMSEKNMATSGNILDAGRYWTAPSIDKSLGTDLFGNRYVANPGALSHVVEPVLKSADQTAIGLNKDNPNASTVLGGAPNGAPVGATNPDYSLNIDQAKQMLTKDLPEAAMTVAKTTEMLPLLGQMMNLVERAKIGGITGPLQVELMQVAKAIPGIENNPNFHPEKITDMQSLEAYGLMPAIEMVHRLTPRGTQQELNSAQKAIGSGATLQPDAMHRVLNEQIANMLNQVESVKATTLKQAADNPMLKDRVAAFAGNTDTEKLLSHTMAIANQSGAPIRLNRDPESQMWSPNVTALRNRELATTAAKSNPNNLPTVSSMEDYTAIPSKAHYLDAYGTERIKP